MVHIFGANAPVYLFTRYASVAPHIIVSHVYASLNVSNGIDLSF